MAPMSAMDYRRRVDRDELARPVVTGPTFGAERDEARPASRLFTSDVIPALRLGAHP